MIIIVIWGIGLGLGFISGLGIALGLLGCFEVVILVIGVIRVIGVIVGVSVIVGVDSLSTYQLDFQLILFFQHQVSIPDNY